MCLLTPNPRSELDICVHIHCMRALCGVPFLGAKSGLTNSDDTIVHADLPCIAVPSAYQLMGCQPGLQLMRGCGVMYWPHALVHRPDLVIRVLHSSADCPELRALHPCISVIKGHFTGQWGNRPVNLPVLSISQNVTLQVLASCIGSVWAASVINMIGNKWWVVPPGMVHDNQRSCLRSP